MPTPDYTTYVGLDVHKKSINVAVLLPERGAAPEQWQLTNERRALSRSVKRLKKLTKGAIVACYEAGPCGYGVQRQLRDLGIDCQVVAPSLIPVQPGDRVKTDRRDALKLAKHLRAGLLTEVHPPSLEDEAVRDLVRAREDAKQDQQRARHRLGKFLLRRGCIYRHGRHWTKRHLEWLNGLRFEQPSANTVLRHYLLVLEQATERLEALVTELEELSQMEPYAEQVGWLCCLRGIGTITAMTILAELHDFRRFTNPRELMSYLGLTPSEHSSGQRRKRGGITKAGNNHVRRVLVESAWSYRHRPAVSSHLKKRRRGQPEAVIAIADRAQIRLHRRYWRLKEQKKKHHNVVTTAIARELVGFIWAVMYHKEQAA